jgi:hypothetical protein
MTDFIAGKKTDCGGGSGGGGRQMTMFMVCEPQVEYGNKHRKFSLEARVVFEAGKELWKYYHAQPKCNVNASLYDIREHFQGRNDNGKMNSKSDDEKYTERITALRNSIKMLAKKIEPKVYEYGFLR